ncbi:MAG: 2-amino-4-hydroxy-6-hydroxymethyldihydropteridine diphosphokinase [Xanthomonadales bacterium]|nr:2-amino-4-hydroxy-6-hydroxymethyldihydropteridine diphosphokinase [Xanthomonadales bacterium]
MTPAYLGIGTNQDRQRNLSECLRRLEERFGPVRRSSVYRSPAVGFDGRDFLNLVVEIHTDLQPVELNSSLKTIEAEMGRRPEDAGFADRCIDVDLLLHGDRVGSFGPVRLPHQDILAYPFILRPLSELAPDLIHPEEQRSLAELWIAMQANSGLQRVQLGSLSPGRLR